jgi:DNA polymerase elongation subunit (family B)
MNKVVFDIETLGFPLEEFSQEQQEYLLKGTTTEEERAEAVARLSLAPFTAQVVAIAMLNPDSGQGKVFYQHPGGHAALSADGLVEFVPGTEEEIFAEFWKAVGRYGQFITFNGRTFDCPFLMLRSAILKIKPTRNLLPYQLTFYGAFRKFSLDFYCRSFGIKSPKSEGISGADVGPLFRGGEYRTIAEYCLGDVRATTELFQRWQSYLAFEK